MKKTNPLFRTIVRPAAFAAISLLAFTAFAAQGPKPPICERSCWGARAPKCSISQMSALTRAIIHHTADANHFNTTGIDASKANVRGVQNYHMDVNGWCDIGYHFLVDKFGNIFEGRSGSMTGLPKGSHDGSNVNSFGFTLMGYFHPPHNQQPPLAMRAKLYDVIAWRMPSAWSPYGSGSYNGRTVGYLDGHRAVKATACPGDVMYNNYVTSNYSGGEARNEVNGRKSVSTGTTNRKGIARTATGRGYWIVASDGGVFSFGDAIFYGSLPGSGVTVNNIIGISSRPQGDGYWLVGSDGGVFCFGAAPFRGSMGGQPLNQPIVGMASTQSGNGYWLVAKDGGIFSFGDAPFHGSLGGAGYSDIVAMAPAWKSDGSNGYWIVRQSGHIYSYNASYYGGGEAGSGVVGIAPNSNGTGYWQVRNTGHVYSYGNVSYQGGANESAVFVGIARGPSNNGYWLLKRDGAIYSFGDAQYHGGANY